MKILISTLGSRGDTQPYIALAVGLQRAGHHVTMIAPHNFVEWIQSYGVDAYPVRFNPQEVTQVISKTKNPFQTMRAMKNVMNTSVMEAMDDCWQVAQKTDFLLQTGTGNGALEAASLRKIPVAFAYLMPMAPTRSFPMFMLPFRFSPGGYYNTLTHKVIGRILWSSMGGPTINRWRARLNLPTWRSESEMREYAQSVGVPSLYGFSPSVIPKPKDWGEDHHITGYWFLDTPDKWQPSRELAHFLESGSKPVYVGFGSMSCQNPERQTQKIMRALELSGQRGVVSVGWGSLASQATSANVFFADDVPHSWLFPKMAAVIHHGGAGTTGTGLQAGVPNIIAPFGGDQYAWADLVVKLGSGLQVDKVQKLTAEKLARAIENGVSDSVMRSRAAVMGERIRAEDGISRAVEVLERHIVQYHRAA